jgi:hypothetical protein
MGVSKVSDLSLLLTLAAKGEIERSKNFFFTSCLVFDTHAYVQPDIGKIHMASFITAIIKNVHLVDPNNYRPMAHTATVCKPMESVNKDQMIHFLSKRGYINSNSQHAFIKHHSTASNLLECIRDGTIGLTHCKQTDFMYIDFAEAFDSIVTSKLLLRLELYGISGQLLKLWQAELKFIANYC